MFLFRIGLKSRGYIADMIGWDDTRKLMRLPEYHFMHYNVETEGSSIHVLKLGGTSAGVVTKEEETKRQEEEQGIKKGHVEQQEIKQPEEPEKKEEETNGKNRSGISQRKKAN